MFKSLFKVPHWWGNGRSESGTPYEILCGCGKACRGRRTLAHQVIGCTGCGRKLFVLPQSPFGRGTVASSPLLLAVPPAVAAPRVNPWLWPVVAGSLTLAIISAVLVLVLSHLQTRTTGPAPVPGQTFADVEGRVLAARKAIAANDFKKAAEELDAAREWVRQSPELMPAADSRLLTNLSRQTALVADWPREPLEQILGRLGTLNAKEWEAVVGGYRGKAIILDVDVRRDATGRFHAADKRPGDVTLRLELQNLKLLHPLPLAEPQRLLFGARLAGVRHEGAGIYVVRFDPESGVLLTDPDVASKCFLQPLDQSMKEVLRRQAVWVKQGQ